MAGPNPTAPLLLPPPATIDDAHKVYSIAAGCAVMCAVASCTVLWRLYLRLKARSFGLDDYAVIVALLCYIAWSTMAVYANLHAGVGKPLWEITLDEYTIWFQVFAGCAFVYPVMSTSIRLSILLFYHRLFATPGSAFQIVNICLMACQIVYLVIFTILPVFTCQPLYAAWTLALYPYKCHPEYFNIITTSLYSTSLALDIVLTVLPLWPVLKLQMPLRKKAGIAVLFLLGTSATTAAAYKLGVWVWNLNRPWEGDPTWLGYMLSRVIPPQFATYGVTYWIPSQIEPTLALICASLPALRPALVTMGRAVGLKLASISRSTNKKTEDGSHGSQDCPVHHPKSSKSSKGGAPKVYFVESGSEAALSGDYFRLDEMHKSRV